MGCCLQFDHGFFRKEISDSPRDVDIVNFKSNIVRLNGEFCKQTAITWLATIKTGSWKFDNYQAPDRK